MGGVMLHGVARTGDEPGGRTGDTPDHRWIPVGRLAALVSDLDDPANGDDPTDLSSHTAAGNPLGDPDTALATAARHNAILVALGDGTTILPVRLGTCFSSDAALADTLAPRQDALLDAVGRIGDAREYAIRIEPAEPKRGNGHGKSPGPGPGTGTEPEASPDANLDHAEVRPVPSAPKNGRAFLLARGKARADRRIRGDRIAMLAASVEAASTAGALELRRLPARSDVRLDLAVLARAPAARRLAEDLAPLAETAQALGLTLRMTGPCPPYSFADWDGGQTDA